MKASLDKLLCGVPGWCWYEGRGGGEEGRGGKGNKESHLFLNVLGQLSSSRLQGFLSKPLCSLWQLILELLCTRQDALISQLLHTLLDLLGMVLDKGLQVIFCQRLSDWNCLLG